MGPSAREGVRRTRRCGKVDVIGPDPHGVLATVSIRRAGRAITPTSGHAQGGPEGRGAGGLGLYRYTLDFRRKKKYLGFGERAFCRSFAFPLSFVLCGYRYVLCAGR
jgi:hypothetical protein